MPTTIIHAEKDATVPVALAEALGKGTHGATIHIIPGEGHLANVQVLEKVNPLPRRRARNPARTCPATVPALTVFSLIDASPARRGFKIACIRPG